MVLFFISCLPSHRSPRRADDVAAPPPVVPPKPAAASPLVKRRASRLVSEGCASVCRGLFALLTLSSLASADSACSVQPSRSRKARGRIRPRQPYGQGFCVVVCVDNPFSGRCSTPCQYVFWPTLRASHSRAPLQRPKLLLRVVRCPLRRCPVWRHRQKRTPCGRSWWPRCRRASAWASWCGCVRRTAAGAVGRSWARCCVVRRWRGGRS